MGRGRLSYIISGDPRRACFCGPISAIINKVEIYNPAFKNLHTFSMQLSLSPIQLKVWTRHYSAACRTQLPLRQSL